MFVKVMPRDYKRVLQAIAEAERDGVDVDKAIMAAAHLLSADGATLALEQGAWNAAYDYYGHDLTGVTYADQVLARALAWSEHGFCVTCETPQALVDSVHAAYGAAVEAPLLAKAAALARVHRRPARTPARRRTAPSR